jgi:hypothetical protein
MYNAAQLLRAAQISAAAKPAIVARQDRRGTAEQPTAAH